MPSASLPEEKGCAPGCRGRRQARDRRGRSGGAAFRIGDGILEEMNDLFERKKLVRAAGGEVLHRGRVRRRLRGCLLLSPGIDSTSANLGLQPPGYSARARSHAHTAEAPSASMVTHFGDD